MWDQMDEASSCNDSLSIETFATDTYIAVTSPHATAGHDSGYTPNQLYVARCMSLHHLVMQLN